MYFLQIIHVNAIENSMQIFAHTTINQALCLSNVGMWQHVCVF